MQKFFYHSSPREQESTAMGTAPYKLQGCLSVEFPVTKTTLGKHMAGTLQQIKTFVSDTVVSEKQYNRRTITVKYMYLIAINFALTYKQ